MVGGLSLVVDNVSELSGLGLQARNEVTKKVSSEEKGRKEGRGRERKLTVTVEATEAR